MKRNVCILTASLLASALGLVAAPKDGASKPAKIKLDPKRGFFVAPVKVKISSEASEAKVYYTTNGSLPGPALGQLWTGPVSIRSTTVLRAAGYLNGKLVTEVDTHTFVFPEEVTRQTGAGFPRTWGVNNGQPVPADYEMDPEVVTNTVYHEGLTRALQSLPTVSIASLGRGARGAA